MIRRPHARMPRCGSVATGLGHAAGVDEEDGLRRQLHGRCVMAIVGR